MAKLVIFGTGDIAQIAHRYFETDSVHEVVAFAVDRTFIKEPLLNGKPVIAFEEVEKIYPPSDYKMFIALSYSKMNKIREQKYYEAKAKRYELVSYISTRCSYLSEFMPGDNCFIFEDNTIQPFAKIGNNVTLWSGNHIGHHSVIHDHNFISSHVVVSGHCIIKSNCFIGVNSALAHNVVVAEGTLLGAGTVISKNTDAGGVYVPARCVKLNKNSFEIDL